MAKPKYAAQLRKATLQMLEGADAIASTFINHEVSEEDKVKIQDALTERFRELKKQMDYVPSTRKFSLFDEDEADDKKQPKPSKNSAEKPAEAQKSEQKPNVDSGHNPQKPTFPHGHNN